VDPTLLTTAAVEPKAQLEAWREWFWPLLDVSSESEDGPFVAENTVWNLGGLLMSRVSAPAVRVTRSKTNLVRAPVDHWVVTYCRAGSTAYSTDQAELKAPAGVPYLWSLGEPSVCVRDQVDRIQIFIPRDAFQDVSSLIDANRSSTLQTPFGLLLASYIDLLERHLPSMTEADANRLGEATRSLIAASFAPTSERIKHAELGIMLGTIERVRQAVQTHLMSPTLGPAFLCSTLGISRSQLYRAFECHGGVDRYIKSRRLLKAFQMLSDPAQKTPIQKIANDFFFANASSFSRAFKQEFDCSPTDVRISAAQGMLMGAMPRSRNQAAGSRFSDLFTMS
jgi:AraC-like DNA-binding protein